MSVPEPINKSTSSLKLKFKKNSPQIYFGSGILGVILSTFLACRSTLKLNETLNGARTSIEIARGNRGENEKEYQRRLALAYLRGVYDVCALYAPSFLIGGLSIAALTQSHITLARRNAALAAAYSSIATAFDEYRARVREEVGEEREREIYMNAQAITIQGEDGEIQALVSATGGPHHRLFDPSNPEWKPSHPYNMTFLRIQEAALTNRLQAQKYLFLNDVYQQLGFPPTPQGQILGWTVGENGGSGYIDFGITPECLADSGNPDEPYIWLDIKPDGNVLDMI